MEDISADQYSAGEQGLGYIYQPRFALLRLLQLPESTSVLIEKDDDLDFLDKDGIKTLASLKHKAVGDRLTDLSTDFWKSVRIWLARYCRDGRSEANLRFFLFTTGTVSDGSVQKTEADADLAAVHRLFELLLKFTQEDVPGFQLIVTEHANLRDHWFQDSLVEQPWTKPPALVPEGWPELKPRAPS